MNKYYLAYGMNTNLDSMKFRCPDARSLGKVTLKNHSLAFKGCCDIVKTPGRDMECVLWVITDNCERSLDILEGYPSFYTKKEVTVKYQNKNIRAMIYYMVDVDALSWPSSSYLRMVAEGYLSHDIELNQIYLALDDVSDSLEEKVCI